MLNDAKLEQLAMALQPIDSLLILPHNDPDPDAIASAVGLQVLLSETYHVAAEVVYMGVIGRAENRALVEYLNRPLRRIDSGEVFYDYPVALVDTQPGTGNNPFPGDLKPLMVLDHHPTQPLSAGAAFADIRETLGATSTMVSQYLREAGVSLTAHLATALFYGIKTDTSGLARGVSQEDLEAYAFLQPLIDRIALANIETAQVPIRYFNSIDQAFHAARLYRNTIIAYLGDMDYPDLGAEVADLFLRLEGVRWVIIMGVFGKQLIISIRSLRSHSRSGKLIQRIVGEQGSAGGHGTMAGGLIPLVDGQDPRKLAAELEARALALLMGSSDINGQPII
ncbi:MAG: DHH family phosphoesterase [Anaerolineales bacterium]|nr:DHH family phosphoesterase [Anaerolineales bacterium]